MPGKTYVLEVQRNGVIPSREASQERVRLILGIEDIPADSDQDTATPNGVIDFRDCFPYEANPGTVRVLGNVAIAPATAYPSGPVYSPTYHHEPFYFDTTQDTGGLFYWDGETWKRVTWNRAVVRNAAGVPAGAPSFSIGELPFAVDTTAVTGGLYAWTGAAWLKVSALP